VDIAVPFVITMITALFISSYLLLDPAEWLYKLLELTYTSTSFKLFMIVLAGCGFLLSFIGEKWVFPKLANVFTVLKTRMTKHQKKRKQYKLILESSGE
jgi:cation-transporting ATPase 13A2